MPLLWLEQKEFLFVCKGLPLATEYKIVFIVGYYFRFVFYSWQKSLNGLN